MFRTKIQTLQACAGKTMKLALLFFLMMTALCRSHPSPPWVRLNQLLGSTPNQISTNNAVSEGHAVHDTTELFQLLQPKQIRSYTTIKERVFLCNQKDYTLKLDDKYPGYEYKPKHIDVSECEDTGNTYHHENYCGGNCVTKTTSMFVLRTPLGGNSSACWQDYELLHIPIGCECTRTQYRYIKTSFSHHRHV